ncbi:GNAT family N-acetyltransferase [Streptomyces sp. NPDC005408]|uniref:GNAT family N-acetyltransferase n=1 Tax=Streptomyces sp. NPDC005408 TaxID=3155341 RepID=UPI0033B5B69B
MTVRTVLADDIVVGHAAVFGSPHEREVTYVIDPAYWGRGIATAALAALIDPGTWGSFEGALIE